MALQLLQRLGMLGLAIFALSLVMLQSEISILDGDLDSNSSSFLPYQIIRVSLRDKPSIEALPMLTTQLHRQVKVTMSTRETPSVRLHNPEEPLDEFLYPTALAIPALRLSDYYFLSDIAKKVRKPRGKFKHLSRIYTKLFVEKKPVHISIFGGSNSAGAGLGRSMKEVRAAYKNYSYVTRLERWLNKYFPPEHGTHVVHNFGRGAVGSCYFLLLFEKLTDPTYLGAETDLYIIETSVNDILTHDMTCFDQLLSRIAETRPDASIMSLHLAAPPDFLKACYLQPASMSECVNGIQPGVFHTKTAGRYKPIERWCDKGSIVDKHKVLQVDLEMLLHMVCKSIAPFQHTRTTTEITNKESRHGLPKMTSKARLLEYVSRTKPYELEQEALLLTEGTYGDAFAYDESVEEAYKKPFKEVNAVIASKIRGWETGPTRMGDLSVFAADRMHIGRWGHLLLTAEIATWFIWLETVGKDGIEEDLRSNNRAADKTVWAAITFDMGYYNQRSQKQATNKHKPARGNSKLDIFPLRNIGEARDWRLFDDSGMQKQGLITESPTSRSISFSIPRFIGSHKDSFVIRVGYLKSYSPNMADFRVDVNETISNRHMTTMLTGRHEEKVSVFVDSPVAVVNGTNCVTLSVSSLPEGVARKVKIVALYVTKVSG